MRTIAVVTGAADPGYGQAITAKLLERGYLVIGTYQRSNADAASQFSKGKAGLSLHQVDLDVRSEIDSFLKTITQQSIDLFVCAHMYYEVENLQNYDHAIWDKSIAINLTAINYLFYNMRKSLADGGAVVVVTSIDGFRGSFGAPAYAATKAAVHSLIKSYAVNFGEKIRFNAVAAGWITNVMGDTYEPFDKNAKEFTPMKRNGQPSEVADAVLYLGSGGASFVNGQILVVDGGYGCVDYVSKCEKEFNENSKS